MKLKLAAALVLAAAAVGASAALGAGRAATLVVDDNKAECPSAAYTSIQAAVNAAASGDTVKVCAGTYNESVTVNKPLRLVGAGKELGARRCLDRTTGENPTSASIVNGGAGPGFDVQANDVTIRGFTVQGSTGNAGIVLARAFSGYRVEANLVQENVFGVYANSDGSRATRIERNCLRDDNKPGSAAGNGVYSDQGLAKASISGNVFTGHQNASVILVGGPAAATAQRDVHLERNRIVKDASVILVNTTDSELDRNVSEDSSGSGIFFGGGVKTTTVSRNVVTRAAFTGVNVRYRPDAYNVTEPNSSNRISRNVVDRSGDNGIAIRDGSSSNTVERNRSSRNGIDGLRIDGGSANNAILRNRMSENKEHDCHDDTTGTRTAGTANTWKDNTGKTENRKGLCKPRGGDEGDDGKKKKKDKDKGKDDRKHDGRNGGGKHR